MSYRISTLVLQPWLFQHDAFESNIGQIKFGEQIELSEAAEKLPTATTTPAEQHSRFRDRSLPTNNLPCLCKTLGIETEGQSFTHQPWVVVDQGLNFKDVL